MAVSEYEKIQAATFNQKIRDEQGLIDDNLNQISFEDLSFEQFALIKDILNVTNNVICMIIEGQQK